MHPCPAPDRPPIKGCYQDLVGRPHLHLRAYLGFGGGGGVFPVSCILVIDPDPFSFQELPGRQLEGEHQALPVALREVCTVDIKLFSLGHMKT